MRIVIRGKAYELTDAVGAAELGDLIVLHKYNGVSIRTMNEFWERINSLLTDKDHPFDPFEVISDPDMLRNIIGIVFLALRKDGPITPADAATVPWGDWHFDFGDDDEAEDEGEADTRPKDDPDAESSTT